MNRIAKVMKSVFLAAVVMGGSVIFASCGGGTTESSQSAGNGDQPQAITLADSLKNPGIGPVKHVDLAALNTEMADKGKTIFESKCATCHKFDTKYVGPPLAGVTKRRTPEWIMNQVLNPAQMIKEDPISMALFAKYLVPMTFQNITEDDARAILEYFRQKDAN